MIEQELKTRLWEIIQKEGIEVTNQNIDWLIGRVFKDKKDEKGDVVKVVRCKDCKHFQPCFVLTGDGERRPYTEEEIKNGKMVTGDVGINCGSRCERFGYWEENKIPVWFSENDYCSYGERSANDNT